MPKFGESIIQRIILFLTFFWLNASEPVHVNMWNILDIDNSFLNNYFESAFTINTSGCTIPKMEVDEHTIRKYLHYPRNIEWCPAKHNPLLQSNQTHIWVATENFIYYNVKRKRKFKCCYRSFYQSTAQPNKIIYLDCIMFNKIIEVMNEMVQVECYYFDKVIHRQFFIFVPKKYSTDQQTQFIVTENNRKFNVIILGLSSISRLNAHRSMPKTFDLLSQFGAIEMFGYHAVGDGSLDNIMPLLSNMHTYELNLTCWPHTPDMNDICPLIWERYTNAGFFTALLQDTADSGIFDSELFGLNRRLPDYYVHHFIKESEIKERLLHKRKSRRKLFFGDYLKNQSLKDLPAVCIEEKYYVQLILEYMEKLTEISRTSKLFVFFWESSLSHNLNAPVLMDDGYEKLIQKLNETGYLNETVLIVLSDEGMNHGGIHKTKQGRLEHRLPLASILVPPSFREQYNVAYESLKINSKRLTTPFDLHETLIDLIDLTEVENGALELRNKSELYPERGTSLFAPIQPDRTCENAGIYNYWCTCHRRKKINIKSNIVQNAVEYVITHLNWLLRLYPQCSKLALDNVIEFEELWPSYRKEIEWREFRLEFRLKPGAGEFEAFIRRDIREWSLLSHIRRLDIYNDPTDCLVDNFRKWYCTCDIEIEPHNVSSADISLD